MLICQIEKKRQKVATYTILIQMIDHTVCVGWKKLLRYKSAIKCPQIITTLNNELWQYYQKHVNQILLNQATLSSLALRIFKAFVQILLIANLSLNQTLLTFLLCVRKTWMTQLILAISL